MNKARFFSLAEMKQPVNQWICIAFIAVLCFWTLLYYFTQKAEAVAESLAANNAGIYGLNAEIRLQSKSKKSSKVIIAPE